MLTYTDEDLKKYTDVLPKNKWDIDAAVNKFNEDYINPMRGTSMPWLGYGMSTETKPSIIPTTTPAFTTVPTKINVLPKNLKGYTSTITNPMLEEYQKRIGYTPATSIVPQRPYSWEDYNLSQAEREREQAIAERRRDIASAQMKSTQQAVDIEKWMKHPSLYKEELKALIAGRIVPPTIPYEPYETALAEAEKAGIEKAKLPTYLEKEATEIEKERAITGLTEAKKRILPGEEMYEEALAGEKELAEAKRVVPRDVTGEKLMSLYANYLATTPPEDAMSAEEFKTKMSLFLGDMSQPTPTTETIPTGAIPLNKTIQGKPAYQLPDGRIWTP